MSIKISQLTASSTDLKSTDLLEVAVYNGTTYDSKKMSGTQIMGERYIGESYGGGVIFHLWRDSGGVQHGLIVGLTNLSTSQAWSNIDSVAIGSTAQSTWDGLPNSNAIVGQSGHTNSAAKLCLDSTANSQSDWYLPSIDELSLIWQNRYEINKTLSGIGGATQIAYDIYWSSTESGSNLAWGFGFSIGNAFYDLKDSTYYVRAVREF